MYAFTSSTVLPSGSILTVPEKHLKLLSAFFETVDATVNESPDQAQTFTRIFTPDGSWKTPRAKFEGHEALIKSGKRFEEGKEPRSMRHFVVELYANDAEGKKLMLMGRVEMESWDGKQATYPFSARVEIDGTGGGGQPRLKSFQGWSSGF